MTTEQVRDSIETGELKLDGWGKFTHYSFVGAMFWVAIVTIFLMIYFGTDNLPVQLYIVFIFVPLILGIWSYRMQRRRLKFKVVETKLSKEELADVIAMVGEKLKWNLKSYGDDFVIAKTNPSFFSGSWGEQITILLDRKRVLINSICDPDKRSSLVSMGRNKQNENTLIAEIQKASQQQ